MGRPIGRWRRRILGLFAIIAACAVTKLSRAEDATPPPAPAPAPNPKDPPPPGPAAAPKDEPKPADPSSNAACLFCHGDPTKAGKHFVDGKAHTASVHGSKDCVECHSDFETAPHTKAAKTVGCLECHEDVGKIIAKGSHGKPPRAGSTVPRAPVCSDCHGVHDTRKAKDRASRLYPLNVPATCGACHGGAPFHDPEDPPGRYAPTKFTDDTHGEGLLGGGLVMMPTCVTCHGGHGTVAPSDPTSPVHASHVADLCGSCHVGIVERYRRSVHGTTARGTPEKNYNAKEPATCTDCHRPHHIRRPGEDMRRATIETCGKCHDDRLGTFRNTYHGRVSDLGFGGAASCADCHTAHDILPTANPNSSVHPGRRTRTCAQCHPGATDSFASYAVHANPDDREHWPILYWARTIMTTLIVVTWCLAGLHILLWFLRAIREPKVDHLHLAGRWYQRWPTFYRALHITVASTFLLLALTGMPLRFHDRWWGQAIYTVLGGPASVRFLHRLGGAITFVYFAVYLVHIARRYARGEKGLFRGPHTMLPRRKDLSDVAANFRYFLKGGARPNFDRWTYWEKFDFWAEVWGVGFIGLTGLLMWFPISSTSILPGWIVNLAHILHSYEALLATGFIFSIHFFHANLRPGKFPMDPIIFTGRIPEAELALERPAEYARMKADGRLERDALPPPDPRTIRSAYIVGGTLMSIGLLLLLLMLLALIS
jgi:cytochrome b subunit of formate dehydrogenase